MVMTVRERKRKPEKKFLLDELARFVSLLHTVFLPLATLDFMCLCLAFGIAVDLYALDCLNQPYILCHTFLPTE